MFSSKWPVFAMLCLMVLGVCAFQTSGIIGGGVFSPVSSGGGGGFTLLHSCVAVGTGTCAVSTTGASAFVILDVSGTTTVTAPTDGLSNTYQVPAAAGFLGTNASAQAYYVCGPTTSGSTIFTGHGASNIYFVSVWSGTPTSGTSCFDKGVARAQAGGSTTYLPGALIPATTLELLLSAVIDVDNGTAWTLPTTGGTWASINTSTGYGADASGYLVDPSNSSINPSWGNTSAPNCGGVFIALNHL